MKIVVKIKQNLGISKFYKLASFPRKKNVGLKAKMQIFTKKDSTKFIKLLETGNYSSILC